MPVISLPSVASTLAVTIVRLCRCEMTPSVSHAMPWPSATRHLRQALGLADRDAHARKSSAMLWIPHRYQVGRIKANQEFPLTAV
jgi:hypothetical protein